MHAQETTPPRVVGPRREGRQAADPLPSARTAPHKQTGTMRHSQRESVVEYTHPGSPTVPLVLSGQSLSSMQRSAAVWQ